MDMSQEEMLAMQKKNCIFCKIISGEIPSAKVYEDEKVLVILDINPANEGHSLVLPKKHFQILPQIPDDLIGHLFVVAKKTSKLLLRGLGVKGTTIFVANGAIAGQKAPHFMVHVVPRNKGDMLFDIPKNAVDPDKLKTIASALSQRMAALTGQPAKVQPVVQPAEQPPAQQSQSASKPQPAQSPGTESSSEKTQQVQHPEEKPKGSEQEKKKDLSIDDITRMFT